MGGGREQRGRGRGHGRARQGKGAEQAERREAAAQGRGEKFDKAKAAMAGGARTVGEATANTVGVAKSKIVRMREGMRFWRGGEKTGGE